MKTIEQKIITSRGKAYRLYARSRTLAQAHKEVKALRDDYPEAFARKAEHCAEIFVSADRP